MRGGERLVKECSWVNGSCFGFRHPTYYCRDFKLSLPLISLFCQSVPKCRLPKNPASPRGKPRGRSHTLLPFIQPFNFVSCGRILSAPTVWVGKLLPFSEQLGCVHFGRLRASPTGLRSFRFSLCTLPGGFGNQRVGTIPVRHCPAALPPAPTDGFYHATNRAVLSAAGICRCLYSLKMFCRLSTPVRIIDSPS